MKLIDSNIIIYSAFPPFQYLRALVKDANNFVSSISQVEVLGYHKISPLEIAYFTSVFSVLQIVPVDDAVIQKGIAIRQKHNLKLGDSLIAASALLFDLKLYTRNEDDFKNVSDLKVVNPVR